MFTRIKHRNFKSQSATPERKTPGKLRVAEEFEPSPIIQPSLKLLSYNIQAGIGTQRFDQYVTGGWKHLVAHRNSVAHIDAIADVVRGYDIVGLQEVDGGSLRSAGINQLERLADKAGFEFHYQQLNRDFGRFGQFSNGILSRVAPHRVDSHQLPGVRGRGAIIAHFGDKENPLVLVNTHLALGHKQQQEQLHYLAEAIGDFKQVILMGDLNCALPSLINSPIGELFSIIPRERASYPSWRPDRQLDHILTSRSLQAEDPQILRDAKLSDHLPVARTVKVADQ